MGLSDQDTENVKRNLRDIRDRCTTLLAHIDSVEVALPTQPPLVPLPVAVPPPNPPPEENPYGPGTLGDSTSNSGNPYTDDPTHPPVRHVDEGTAKSILDMAPMPNEKDPVLRGMKVLAKASEQQGKRYKFGAAGPDQWDCSALAQWAYRKALGIEIGRTTYEQIKGGQTVKFSESRAGDLIFSNFEGGNLTRPGHVSINMDGPDNVFEAGDPVGVYKWGNRGQVIVKRYV